MNTIASSAGTRAAVPRPRRRKSSEPVDRFTPSGEIPSLSASERAQLGKPSHSRVRPTAGEWKNVRRFLVEKSQKRDPALSAEMTAYTPGETLQLMRKWPIRRWQTRMKTFEIPRDADLVVLVPCAATKPWDTASRGIYKSYNDLRQEMARGKLPRAYFVTVSEPLGIVPEAHWGDFPTYDDPGLFRNDSARAGRTTTREWLDRFGQNYVLPFDEKAYRQSIDRLSDVIADFARHNARPGRTFLSFVDDANGTSTHTDMLTRANEKFHFLPRENMYPKRTRPREAPYSLLKEKIREHAT
ncbi:MAG: DUF5591 domain-containing protein [Armatimonadetes bacterium]|nr:DUF5591 domain-containing protein [Armatimonadota bacterium]